MPTVNYANRARTRNILVESRTATWVLMARDHAPEMHAHPHDRGFVIPELPKEPRV